LRQLRKGLLGRPHAIDGFVGAGFDALAGPLDPRLELRADDLVALPPLLVLPVALDLVLEVRHGAWRLRFRIGNPPRIAAAREIRSGADAGGTFSAHREP
jgi:hypothetical protein